MKRNEFNSILRNLRKHAPTYNNERTVKILSSLTKDGSYLISQVERAKATILSDVYMTYSTRKMVAYEEAWEMYKNIPDSSGFRIISKNGFGFSVGWKCPDRYIILTPVTEYHVIDYDYFKEN